MFSKQGTRSQGTEQTGGRRWGKVRNCYYNYSKAKCKVKNKQCLNVNPLLPPKIENSYQEVNKNVIPYISNAINDLVLNFKNRIRLEELEEESGGHGQSIQEDWKAGGVDQQWSNRLDPPHRMKGNKQSENY